MQRTRILGILSTPSMGFHRKERAPIDAHRNPFQLPQWDSEGEGERGVGLGGVLSTPSMGFRGPSRRPTPEEVVLSTPSMGFYLPPDGGRPGLCQLSTPSMGFQVQAVGGHRRDHFQLPQWDSQSTNVTPQAVFPSFQLPQWDSRLPFLYLRFQLELSTPSMGFPSDPPRSPPCNNHLSTPSMGFGKDHVLDPELGAAFNSLNGIPNSRVREFTPLSSLTFNSLNGIRPGPSW